MQILQVRSVKSFLAVVLGLIACSNLVKVTGNPSWRSETAETQLPKLVDERLIAANSKFSFKLYQEILKQSGSNNVFVSPASVMLALAMTLNGAEGPTREAMARTLELEGMSLEEVNKAASDLTSALRSTDPKIKLSIANSIWARNGLALKPAFVQRLKTHYAAEVAMLDFNSPAAPATINAWVNRNTEGKIEKIIDGIEPDKVLFLINAIYFKGQWQFSFEKEKTADDVFKRAGAREKKLPMMFQTGRYLYQKSRSFQAIALPYGNGKMSMYIFLPHEKASLDQFERDLTSENWDAWIRGFRFTPGELKLPRFKIDFGVNLNDMLKALGMSDAFDPQRANFSGIAESGNQKLYISEVKHKAIAEVNEEGTVAAAVTSVGVTMASAQPPQEPFVMKVDRPFFIAIRDNTTQALLFMGSVRDPQ